ncbi:MAG: hypothetical protein RH981_18925 [Arenibacter sp.]
MCKQNNIENLGNVCCALSRRLGFPVQSKTDIDLTVEQLKALQSDSRAYYYGLLTVGKDTSVDIVLADSQSVIEVTANNQIIEVFNGLTITGNNAYFRGYVVRF